MNIKHAEMSFIAVFLYFYAFFVCDPMCFECHHGVGDGERFL